MPDGENDENGNVILLDVGKHAVRADAETVAAHAFILERPRKSKWIILCSKPMHLARNSFRSIPRKSIKITQCIQREFQLHRSSILHTCSYVNTLPSLACLRASAISALSDSKEFFFRASFRTGTMCATGSAWRITTKCTPFFCASLRNLVMFSRKARMLTVRVMGIGMFWKGINSVHNCVRKCKKKPRLHAFLRLGSTAEDRGGGVGALCHQGFRKACAAAFTNDLPFPCATVLEDNPQLPLDFPSRMRNGYFRGILGYATSVRDGEEEYSHIPGANV